VIHRDRAPLQLAEFPGIGEILIGETIPPDTDAVVVLECGDLGRTGLVGFDHPVVINIDHHLGNTGYGTTHWFDGSAAACGEMIFEIIMELGVPLTEHMATQLFVALVTDTGSFRYPGVSPRTFSISARLLEAGADPVNVARKLFDSNTLGRLRLQGAVLHTMEIDETGRLAILRLDDAMPVAAGGTAEETDGLINLPLSVKAIQAAVFFKEAEHGQWRVSLRSKGDIDVGRVARVFGGGGHKNAAGCTLTGALDDVKARVFTQLAPEIAVSPVPASPREPGA
jgi:phosphoesterase RecJ-like protein